MTNTERKASDLQSILSFLPFLLPPPRLYKPSTASATVIGHVLSWYFTDDVRVSAAISYRDVTQQAYATSLELRKVHVDLSSRMLFALSKKRLNGMPSSLSFFLSFSSLLRAVWKLNVKQSGTGREGRETYGGAISWRGIDFYQDRGGGGGGRMKQVDGTRILVQLITFQGEREGRNNNTFVIDARTRLSPPPPISTITE